MVPRGFHLAPHPLALFIAAVAYSYARRHANDPRFVFGTGKLGDLAGFTSALVLAIIALMIGYEATVRLFSPVPIHFDEAILIAASGLIVNIATAWLLSADGGDHHRHARGHGVRHRGGHHAHAHGEPRRIDTGRGILLLEVFEDGVPPHFRLRPEDDLAPGSVLGDRTASIETECPGGARQNFCFADRGAFLESV